MASAKSTVKGKLSFDLQDGNIIGRGKSKTTIVVKGFYEGTIPVAIKRILKNDTRIIEAEQLRQYDRHQNIVRYYVTESDDFFHHIGMELCNGTLEQLIRGQYTGPPIGKDKEILRQIASAIEYLSRKGLVNRNITPDNILISQPDGPDLPKMKLVDFSICREFDSEKNELEFSGTDMTQGWTAPELLQQGSRYTGAVDVFSAGCVFAYFLSRGRHPFGEVVNRQCNIHLGKEEMPSEITDLAATDLITKMLKRDPTERISIQQVLAHPYFWNEGKSLSFIQSACKVLQKVPDLVKCLEADKDQIFDGEWPDLLTPSVKSDLLQRTPWRKNDPGVASSVFHLLKTIDFKSVHFFRVSEEARADYGYSPESYFDYWSRHFPRLLMRTWIVLRAKCQESDLREFYETK